MDPVENAARFPQRPQARRRRGRDLIHHSAGRYSEEVQKNLSTDELEHRDVLIVFADPFKTKPWAARVSAALSKRGIRSHLAGVTTSVDELFDEESIALSGIFRAKGNEAGVVYVLGAEYAESPTDLIRRRNILFTAITRSRGWVRICGSGDGMKAIEAEVKKVEAAGYTLSLQLPSAEQLAKLRRMHRDLSADEKEKLKRFGSDLLDIIGAVRAGELPPEAVPLEYLELLEALRSHRSDS